MRERRGTPARLLVLGLGNPGPEYQATRHNVGAAVVELLAKRNGSKLKSEKRCRALLAEVRSPLASDDGPVVFAFPQTFMNDSGLAARKLVQRYSIDDLSRLVVVHDELDLPPGRVKVKAGGGTAGHNGLESLRSHLHDTGFCRVRIGIGKPPHQRAGVDYVLKRPGRAEAEVLDAAIERAADAVEMIARDGLEATMNTFNVG